MIDKGKGKRTEVLAVAAGTFFLCASALSVRAHDRITTKVSWDREIAPIFEARCVNCHQQGGKSTIPLATYQQARPWAVAIKEEVLTRRMPKWNAARGYGAFANDPTLAPFEIALIAAWVDGGAPETDKNRVTTSTASATTKPNAFAPPAASSFRTTSIACGPQPVSGQLLAIRPTLEKNGSVGVAAMLPNGREEIIAWIRDYDPQNPTTYWLLKPVLLPAGSRLIVTSSSSCSLELTFGR